MESIVRRGAGSKEQDCWYFKHKGSNKWEGHQSKWSVNFSVIKPETHSGRKATKAADKISGFRWFWFWFSIPSASMTFIKCYSDSLSWIPQSQDAWTWPQRNPSQHPHKFLPLLLSLTVLRGVINIRKMPKALHRCKICVGGELKCNYKSFCKTVLEF